MLDKEFSEKATNTIKNGLLLATFSESPIVPFISSVYTEGKDLGLYGKVTSIEDWNDFLLCAEVVGFKQTYIFKGKSEESEPITTIALYQKIDESGEVIRLSMSIVLTVDEYSKFDQREVE